MKRFVFSIISCILVLTLIGCTKSEISNIKTVEDIEKVHNIDVSDGNTIIGNILFDIQGEIENKKIPLVSEQQNESALIFTLMDFKNTDVENYAIITSKDDSEAYTLAIIEPKLGKEESVIYGMFERVMHLREVFEEDATQQEICKNAVFEQYGGYLILVITEDSSNDYERITSQILEKVYKSESNK